MCGIAGIVRQDKSPVERMTLELMVRAMVHRGPDDQGIWMDRSVGLGHRRLSIIDRSSGHQPLCNEDESVWIAFNGEIYNYQEIREELLANGHTFRTKSDTEVIVHLYEDLGEGCVQRLHGMFAFAIWDRRTETLLLARDRMGIKPLYYASTPKVFAFASEIKPLLTLNEIQPSLNYQGLHDYLTHRYTTAPRTAWQNVLKLEPGHLLMVRDGRVTKKVYWDLDFSKKLVASEQDLIEECQRRLRASTKSHLVGEVPHGVFLSGGIDSTAITGLVSELSGKQVKSYSVGFVDGAGDPRNEMPYARLAAQHFGTDHHERSVDLFLLEDVEDLRSPFGVRTVIEAERDLVGMVAVLQNCVAVRVRIHMLIDDEFFARIGLVGVDYHGAFAGLRQAGDTDDFAIALCLDIVAGLHGIESGERFGVVWLVPNVPQGAVFRSKTP